MSELPILLRLLATSVGLAIASATSGGVGTGTFGVFVLTVLLLTFLGVLLKPVLVLLMLPFVVLTLGLGLWVVNACMVMLAAEIIPSFEVAGWGSGFWCAFWISVATMLAASLTQRTRITIQRGRPPSGFPKRKVTKENDDDVIDI